MTPKREYSILPQGEGDFHHHVREGRPAVTSQYICLVTVIAVVICLILAGVATLTASMFYSDQVSTTFGHIWYSYESKTSNATSTSTSTTTKTTSGDSSFTKGSSAFPHEPRNHSASVANHNPTDYSNQQNKTLDSNHRHHHHTHHNKNSSGDSASYGYNGSGSGLHNSDNSTGDNDTSSESEESDSTAMETTEKDQEFIDMEELKDKFGEAMRDFEKYMENITGVRKAEFLVPIFMLICFLSVFSIISLCCCVMMRRRDNRRRKLFGKLITDLQTGDSKTVLLNHSDLDD